MRTLFAAIFLITALGVRAQDPSQEGMRRMGDLAKAQTGWNARINSPGVEVVVRETKRTKTDQGTAVRYELFVKGAARDKLYNLVYWELGKQPATTLSGITLNEEGRAIVRRTARNLRLSRKTQRSD